jgi:cellobiose transport system permease protein
VLPADKLRAALGQGVLFLGVLFSVFPFYWMLVMASNTSGDIFAYPPKLLPGSHLLENMGKVMDQVDLLAPLGNTLFVAVVGTTLVLFFDSLAAFAFAKYDFPAKKALFALLLATMLVPAQMSLVPSFITLSWLGWVGSLKALIIPGMANAFGIFWLRQYATNSVPDELIHAARVDGAGFFRQYWSVVLPLLRPGLAFLGIFGFIASWNDYLWPLIVLTNPDTITLQVALQQLQGVLFGSDYAVIMAGAVMAVTPLIGVFLIGARNLIADLAAGAMKF